MNGYFIKLTKDAVKEISKNNLTGMVLSYLCCNQGVGTGVCKTSINDIVSDSGCTCDRHSNTGINKRVKNCLIELEEDGFINSLDNPATGTDVYIQKPSYADDLYLQPYNPSKNFVMMYTDNYYKLIQYSLKNGYKFADLINLYIFIISHIMEGYHRRAESKHPKCDRIKGRTRWCLQCANMTRSSKKKRSSCPMKSA